MACDVKDGMLSIHLMVKDMVNGVNNRLSRKSVDATYAT